MIFRRYTFTILSFFTCLGALYYEEMFFSHREVSHETPKQESHTGIREGVSQNGAVSVVRVDVAPPVPLAQKIPNQPRTLRAYFSTDVSGQQQLYLESAVPHYSYRVSGDFIFDGAYLSLHWVNNNTLQFYARAYDGKLVHIFFDPTTTTAFIESLDVFDPIVLESRNAEIAE